MDHGSGSRGDPNGNHDRSRVPPTPYMRLQRRGGEGEELGHLGICPPIGVHEDGRDPRPLAQSAEGADERRLDPRVDPRHPLGEDPRPDWPAGPALSNPVATSATAVESERRAVADSTGR